MKNLSLLLKTTLLVSLLCNVFLDVHLVFAQEADFTTNKNLHRIAETGDSPGWISFKNNISASDIFEQHKSAFDLTSNDEMQLMKMEKDDLGFTHYRFQQWHKGLEVEGAQFFIHAKDGIAINGNGTIVTNIKRKEKATISPSEVIELAKSYLPADVYMWEDIEEEKKLKELRNDLFASYAPMPRLMLSYQERNGTMDLNSLTLTYRVEIHAKAPHDSQALYIDAETGEIRKYIPLEHNCSNGVGCTLYNGTQGIQTDRIVSSVYRLFDDCRGNGINTRRHPNTNLTNWGNSWFSSSRCEGVSLHWAMEKTYDYFLNNHNRNSYNNAGATVNAFTQNNGLGTDNAFWSPSSQTLNFGAGGGSFTTGPLVSLDVAGHEFTHAVTQFSAGLIYSGESGCLNESFSDIFGTMVEGSSDYLIGEDAWIVDGYLRSMSDPKAKTGTGSNAPSPDTYLGDFWTTQVHKGSGVQNHWFYLLAQGSSATDRINDNGQCFSVYGIGRAKAARIAYRNLTVYLNNSSNYAAARAGSIQAATDIYGANSNEVRQTRAAWDAVGVYGPGAPAKPAKVTGASFVPCSGAWFNVCPVPNATSYVWSFSTNCGYVNGSTTTSAFLYGNNNCPYSGGGLLCVSAKNSSGTSPATCLTLGIQSCSNNNQYRQTEDSVKEAPSVFPNPAIDEVQVSFSNQEEEVLVDVFDLAGKRIKTIRQKNTTQFMLDVSALTPGMYMLNIKTATDVFTEKIIIKK
ncbi:MAG: M4 family metallopeptidase [Saprospiraceae bacterium]